MSVTYLAVIVLSRGRRRTIVALVSVLALVLVAPAPAQAEDTQDTRLTANAKPEPVAKGHALKLTGTLKTKKDGRWAPTPRTKLLAVVFDPAGSGEPRRVATIRRTVWVGNNDYHRLDADNDGWGCDSYS